MIGYIIYGVFTVIAFCGIMSTRTELFREEKLNHPKLFNLLEQHNIKVHLYQNVFGRIGFTLICGLLIFIPAIHLGTIIFTFFLSDLFTSDFRESICNNANRLCEENDLVDEYYASRH